MKKKITILLLMICGICNAQNPNIKRSWHWYFGLGAGLDFSSGNPIADTTGNLNTYEGAGVISDTSGNLLFYTDGDTVWNRNHQPMPNGTGLFGCPFGSSTQTGLIVPQPDSNTLFYVFTTDCDENSGATGFRYSIVDMSLNSGMGDVVIKNILLYTPSTEGLAATLHCNGKDVWVITHEYNTNCWLTYKITNAGLNTTPVISYIGPVYIYYLSKFVFSPDGSKLASFGIQDAFTGPDNDLLFDFNNSSGTVCNLITLFWAHSGGFHPAFSPDNTKLYYAVSSVFLYQYNLGAGNDSATISNSAVIIDSAYYVGIIALAPDGKIYTGETLKDSLGTIHNPNAVGLACNYVHSDLSLNGKQVFEGMTSFISNYLGDTTICNTCLTGINESSANNSLNIYPTPFHDELIIINNNNNVQSEIILYDLSSRKLLQQTFTNTTTINTEQFAKGMYLYEVRNKDGVTNKGKVVKQ